MRSPGIDGPDAVEYVGRIIEVMESRCRALENLEDVAERVRRYREDVLEFVRLINAGFFNFVTLLNDELSAKGLGSAVIVIRPAQPDLASDLDPMQGWAARRFCLVRADLSIRLRYLVRSVQKHEQSLTAAVFFWPTGGMIEWTNGDRERFRSHREDVFDDHRFGALDLWDMVAKLGLRRSGREENGAGAVVDDPETIIIRRICADDHRSIRIA